MKSPVQTRLSLFSRLLSFIEQKPISDRLFLRGLALLILGSGLYLTLTLNASYIVDTPTSGGVLNEGIIGTPRFVNPVLAVTRADQDTAALVYRGLMKIDETGTLVPDIAASITVSEDGRTYNVLIKDTLRFHDGTPLTARDVAYTITLIQNPDLKSPLRGNWDGVLIEELGEYELNIVLEEPYTPFIENFTVGIIPRHIWDELPPEQLPFSQHNIEPIGAGPFMISAVARNKSGLVNRYTLTRFPDYEPQANLERINLYFFENEAALVNAYKLGNINSSGQLPAATLPDLSHSSQVIETVLPRTFGVFFNQNRSAVLRDSAVRQALDVAIDRDELVRDLLLGHGVPTTGPVPTEFLTVHSSHASTTATTSPQDEARRILQTAGWKRTEDGTWTKTIDDVPYTLAVTVRTDNSALFEQTANAVAERWRELGVLVNVELFEQADLVPAVIRPRDFEALLFGTDLGRGLDLFAFWHSSQQNDPGLNIAQYANLKVDELLDERRTTTDGSIAQTALQEILEVIGAERPAIFLFAPTFTYVVDESVTVAPLTKLSRPHERFMNITTWHAQTASLWPLFIN